LAAPAVAALPRRVRLDRRAFHRATALVLTSVLIAVFAVETLWLWLWLGDVFVHGR
jgi:hypothetical protein